MPQEWNHGDSCRDVLSLCRKVSNIPQENDLEFNSSLKKALFKKAMPALKLLWEYHQAKDYDTILEQILQSVFFREALIKYIQENKIDAKDFCHFIINQYKQHPSRFLLYKSEYEYVSIRNSEVRSHLEVLLEPPCQYSEFEIPPLRMFVALIPNDISFLVDLLTDIQYSDVQYNICHYIVSEICDNYFEHVDELLDTLVRLFPQIQFGSWDSGQDAFLELFKAIWYYVVSLQRFDEKSKKVLHSFFVSMTQHQNVNCIVPLLGCYFATILDGVLVESENSKESALREKILFSLNELKSLEGIVLDINALWGLISENSKITRAMIHDSFQKAGIGLNTRTSFLSAFVLYDFLGNAEDPKKNELILLALESNDRILATCAFNAGVVYPLWETISNYICKDDDTINYWIGLRENELEQHFYRYRFQHARPHKQSSNYSIKTFIIISINIVDKLIDLKKIEKAVYLFHIVWNDFLVSAYLSWGFDEKFFQKSLWYLLCIKTELNKSGNVDDIDELLKTLPSKMGLRQAAEFFLKELSK